MQVAKGRLGDRLIDKAYLTQAQLEVALNEQRRAHRPLGEILTSLGFVRAEHLTELVAEDMGVAFLRARDLVPDPLILSAIEPAFVRETAAFPYELVDGVLRVVMVDPEDPEKVSAVRQRFPYPLEIGITTEDELLRLIRDNLQSTSSQVADVFAELREREGADLPVERVTTALLIDGVHRGATDIHIEPDEHVTRVRFRIDGILQSGENLPTEATPAIISRIKVMSDLNISERRRPQDGRLRVEVDDRQVDMRVSIMPTVHGENVVLRILDRSGGTLDLVQLGMSLETQRLLKTVADRPHGVFLVTGPTGSGKTTTLYAMLGQIDAMHRNVTTIEDPIEYPLPLLRQSQVDPTIGYGFHEGLRSLLRQDPDVLLVGEIRDRETADMTIKAAMTGHLVLSTLHTNSAIGAIGRLVDIGIEPYLIQDSLIGVMAQRLIRTVCEACAEEYTADDSECRWLDVEGIELRRGRGCERCNDSGFKGRTAIMELFLPDEEIAEAVRTGANPLELHRIAQKSGFRSMVEDGRRLVREGRTTMREIRRVNSSHLLSKEEREVA